MFKNYLCRIGIHRWEFKTTYDIIYEVIFARCKNPYCSKYKSWRMVHKEFK